MKKSLLLALLAGIGTNAGISAAGLPEATIYSGIMGDYSCSQGGMDNINVRYLVDGKPIAIDFVKIKVYYAPDDIDHEYPFYYCDATLTNPDGVETNIRAGIYTPQDVEAQTLSTRAADRSGTAVTFQLSQLTDYEWIEGEYKISLPEKSFKDAEGNVNPAQEIRWVNLTQSVTCPDANISPAPKKGQVSGFYSPEQLKAVTLTFDGEVVYNFDSIIYGDNNDIVPLEKVKFEGNQLILDLSFVPAGIISFEIPTGFMTVGGSSLFIGKSFTYEIWDGLPQGEMIAGPKAKGDKVPNIELYFGQPIQAVGGVLPPLDVYKNRVSGDPAFQIPSDCIKIMETTYPAEEGNETVSVLYLEIEELFTRLKGTYIISIPEGYVENADHELNPAQQIKFKIIPVAEEPSISMKNGIVNIIWNGSRYFKTTDAISAYVILPDGSKRNLSFTSGSLGGGLISEITSGIQVDLTGIIAENGDGAYVLVLPEAYLEMKLMDVETINGEVVYEFVIGDISGVESIMPTEDTEEIIYNLNGMRVDRNKMTNGIYIINGRKVVVRNL